MGEARIWLWREASALLHAEPAEAEDKKTAKKGVADKPVSKRGPKAGEVKEPRRNIPLSLAFGQPVSWPVRVIPLAVNVIQYPAPTGNRGG